MSIITLTTDLGLKDYYVSAIKGAILNKLPNATIIDISHHVPTYNIQDAAYILKNAYKNYPKGSIHIIGVDDEAGSEKPHMIVEADDHYFLAADNGIFSLLLDVSPSKIIQITKSEESLSTFSTKDILAKTACEIALGKTIEEMGIIKTSLTERMPFRAASIGDMIRGTVVYTDSYGNVMTNISKELFNQVGKNRGFIIEFARYEILKLSNSYNEVREGEILALFNSSNTLEIAMRNDKASSMLNLKLNDTITIHFND